MWIYVIKSYPFLTVDNDVDFNVWTPVVIWITWRVLQYVDIVIRVIYLDLNMDLKLRSPIFSELMTREISEGTRMWIFIKRYILEEKSLWDRRVTIQREILKEQSINLSTLYVINSFWWLSKLMYLLSIMVLSSLKKIIHNN